ncbi:hypothetical protein B0H19DRAFT_1253465 [Mycena capillaripes]|nr:hypothetical protein B0H19DRAFT_1253465 [Mycena capillaripes]
MHRDLRLANLTRLPPALRRLASAASSSRAASSDAVDRFLVEMGDISDAEATACLPVLYVLLDPAAIPTMEELDTPAATFGRRIRQILHALRLLVIYTIKVPIHLGTDLWPRVWEWSRFVYTYQEQFPEPLLDESAFCVNLFLFASNFRTKEGPAPYIRDSAGFRFMIARAWMFVLEVEDDDWRDHCLTCLATFFRMMDAWIRENLEELIDGAGGSIDQLAVLVIGYVRKVLEARETPIGWMGIGEQCIYTPLGRLSSALVPHDVASLFARTACAVSDSSGDDAGILYTLDICFFLSGRIFLDRAGRSYLPSALSNGLLQALISSAHIDGTIQSHLDLFFRVILPRSLVSYETLAALEGPLMSAETVISSLHMQILKMSERWQRFVVATKHP